MKYETYTIRLQTQEEIDTFLLDKNIKCLGIYTDTEKDKEDQPHILINPGVSKVVAYQLHNDSFKLSHSQENKGNRNNHGKYGL